MALKGKDNAEKIWNYFKSKKLNDYAVAIMGSIAVKNSLRINMDLALHSIPIGHAKKNYMTLLKPKVNLLVIWKCN